MYLLFKQTNKWCVWTREAHRNASSWPVLMNAKYTSSIFMKNHEKHLWKSFTTLHYLNDPYSFHAWELRPPMWRCKYFMASTILSGTSGCAVTFPQSSYFWKTLLCKNCIWGSHYADFVGVHSKYGVNNIGDTEWRSWFEQSNHSPTSRHSSNAC